MNIIDLATKTMQTTIKGVVEAIKTVVDVTKTKVDTIDERTTITNTAVDTVNTNVNAIKTTLDSTKTNVDTLLAGRVVKSVQRGTANIKNLTNLAVPIDSVNSSRSLVFISYDAGANGALNGSAIVRVSLQSVNSISLFVTGAINVDRYVEWQVVEFY